MKTYRKIEDPGHGWLEVPYADVKEFGVIPKISACSYYDNFKKLCYLEEDLDMSIFLNELSERGISSERTVDYSYSKVGAPECFVRNLLSFSVLKTNEDTIREFLRKSKVSDLIVEIYMTKPVRYFSNKTLKDWVKEQCARKDIDEPDEWSHWASILGYLRRVYS